MYCLEDLNELKQCLVKWAKDNKDCCEDSIPLYGEVIDMIKDLYEAEKECYESWYYAMAAKQIGDESNDSELNEMGRYGYTNYRRNSSGEYTPKTITNKKPMHDDPWPTTKPIYGELDAWNDSRKYYHETHDSSAKTEMDQHAVKHVHDIVGTVEEMYSESSPETKKKLKEELSQLLSKMS